MAHWNQQHDVGRINATPLPHEGVDRGGGGVRGRYGKPAQYQVSFPTILAWLRCPVEGYQGTPSSDKPPGAIFSPTPLGQNINTGGVESTPPPVPPV